MTPPRDIEHAPFSDPFNHSSTRTPGEIEASIEKLPQPESASRRETLNYQGPFSDAGYPKLASLMGANPESAIFRSFPALQSLNLLRLQAQLNKLEKDCAAMFRKGIEGSYAPNKPQKLLSKSFILMMKNEEHTRLLEDIRAKLKEYSYTALAEYSAVASLHKPVSRDLHELRNWLESTRIGEGGNFLGAFESGMWDDDQNERFVTMAGDDLDRTLWASKLYPAIASWFSNSYQRLESDKRHQGRLLRAQKKGGIIIDNGSKSFTGFLITITAAMLPALSILGLYYEHDILNRIGIMIGLTTAFAAILAIFTEAKRIEIFSAVAAFAAVEVVFIGTADIRNLT